VRTAARILVDQLLVHGVDMAYCVPGESYLDVLDAFVDTDVRLITARHEAAAANMAVAYGKLTGRPGICFVTRAPGATHASVGIHTAYQDSTPMILLVGQVPRGHIGREAFQELDYARMFGEMAKWVASMDAAADVPGLVARAGGRPAQAGGRRRRGAVPRRPCISLGRGGRPRTGPDRKGRAPGAGRGRRWLDRGGSA
jgi:acetolactate synthase-1/2/3 large subunit